MERTKKNTKRKIVDTVMGVVLACGIGILSYPFIRNSLNDLMNQQIIQHYQQQANQKSTEEYQQKLAEMEAKNKQFAYQNISPGFDPFSEEAKKVEDLKTVYEDHVLGVISIPKIQIRLPIFDQTREDFLARGATYLEGTSFPIGGESTHSVISGHRGLTEAKLFTDLPDLVEGDRFYIELKESEIHAYQVDKIQVVDPSDVSSLQIVEGQDYVTLVTCTPYMVNSHRILVRGHRIPYKAEIMEAEVKQVADLPVNYIPLFIGIPVSFIFLAILLKKCCGKMKPSRKSHKRN
ncbi:MULTISPECIES: class C sortase [Streptococcus]|uniref:Sortase family protein n=4 Tax=Streptococcus suis TaxID=1307 RepID=A0A0Z8EKB1_STRSU|nr:class C sortase [Streptococcus suis]MCO8230336.1 class C sortase [Streptococcus suis]NQG68704.1 class C sortase [Streptococcus suis]NQH85511.1 class C sortase [Streptococcus suis]CYU63699.1 sortase family protein [Streptococcus suis]CYV48917.1 sortase family protein [Streptococcus suis]